MRVSDHASIGHPHQNEPFETMNSPSQSGSSTCSSFEEVKATINIPMTPEAAIGYLLSEFHSVRAFIATIPTLLESIQNHNDKKLDALISGLDRLSNDVISLQQRGSSTAFESPSLAPTAESDPKYGKIQDLVGFRNPVPAQMTTSYLSQFSPSVAPKHEDAVKSLVKSIKSEEPQYERVIAMSESPRARSLSAHLISPYTNTGPDFANPSPPTSQSTVGSFEAIDSQANPQTPRSFSHSPTIKLPNGSGLLPMTPPSIASSNALDLSPPAEVMGFPRPTIDYPFDDYKDPSYTSSPELLSLPQFSSSQLSPDAPPFAHLDAAIECRVIGTEEEQASADVTSESGSAADDDERRFVTPPPVLRILSPTSYFAAIIPPTPQNDHLSYGTLTPRTPSNYIPDPSSNDDGQDPLPMENSESASSIPSALPSCRSSPNSNVSMRFCRTATPALSNFQTRQEIEEEDVGVKVEDLEKSPYSNFGLAGKPRSDPSTQYSSPNYSPQRRLAPQTLEYPTQSPESFATRDAIPFTSNSVYFTPPLRLDAVPVAHHYPSPFDHVSDHPYTRDPNARVVTPTGGPVYMSRGWDANGNSLFESPSASDSKPRYVPTYGGMPLDDNERSTRPESVASSRPWRSPVLHTSEPVSPERE